jgi:hypothetical protein
MKTIKDITGKTVEVTDLKAAIKQCRACSDSHYRMASGHTVGEDNRFMLAQLERLLQDNRRGNWLPNTKKKYDEGKRFTKEDIGYEIGRHDPYHPAYLYWDSIKRDDMVRFFNQMFGTEIK